MSFSADQLLFLACALWLALLAWPQAARHFAELLSRHACALSGLYLHMARGFRCYASRWRNPPKAPEYDIVWPLADSMEAK